MGRQAWSSIINSRSNRIIVVKAEFFCHELVMSFLDRPEQPLAEADRWVKGCTCKIKGSAIGGETCH
jgi:hypothetical protein